MLKAMVEEINRYNESPAEILKMLNVKLEYSGRETHYDVVLKLNGVVIDDDFIDDSNLSLNPLRESVEISYSNVPSNHSNKNGQDDFFSNVNGSRTQHDEDEIVRGDDIKLKFTPEHIVNIDSKTGVYRYEKDGYELTLTRWVRKEYDLVV
jgi:hypothetical protein